MNKLERFFLLALIVVSSLTVGLQFPAVNEQKSAAHDKQVVRDLEAIKRAVSSYELSKQKLPKSITDISLSDEDIKARLDAYEYKPGTGSNYELCANFKTDSSRQDTAKSTPANESFYDTYSATNGEFNSHKKGQECFKLSVGYGSSLDYSQSSIDAYGSSFSRVQEKSKDTHIKSDINSLHAQIEAYYAVNDSYPTLAQLKDSNWRSTNMKGADAMAFTGPNNESIGSGYNYLVTPANCTKDCSGYTLSAKLSDGTIYTKKALN